MITSPFNVDVVRDRLRKGFASLRDKGYIAKANWKCCQGCGCAALPEGTKQYVFYHAQDREQLVQGKPFCLAWGGDASVICEALRTAGLLVEHDGSSNKRIMVTGVDNKMIEATGYQVGQRVMVRGDRAQDWRHAEISKAEPYRGQPGFYVSNLDVDPTNSADSAGGWTYPAYMRPIPADRPIIHIRPLRGMRDQVLLQMWRPTDKNVPSVSQQFPADYARWIKRLAEADEKGPE